MRDNLNLLKLLSRPFCRICRVLRLVRCLLRGQVQPRFGQQLQRRVPALRRGQVRRHRGSARRHLHRRLQRWVLLLPGLLQRHGGSLRSGQVEPRRIAFLHRLRCGHMEQRRIVIVHQLRGGQVQSQPAQHIHRRVRILRTGPVQRQRRAVV